jgi:ABC-type branched-subunit amino acid transport system ATPase component
LTKVERTTIGATLQKLTGELGFAAILVEHDLDFVRDISTSVVVLHQGKLVLDGSAVAGAPGQIFALMGKNGMGKTTVLKTILGFVALRSGDIRLDGASISGVSQASLIASGVGYAPQEQALFQDLSVRDNLRLALRSDRGFRKQWNGFTGIFRSSGSVCRNGPERCPAASRRCSFSAAR